MTGDNPIEQEKMRQTDKPIDNMTANRTDYLESDAVDDCFVVGRKFDLLKISEEVKNIKNLNKNTMPAQTLANEIKFEKPNQLRPGYNIDKDNWGDVSKMIYKLIRNGVTKLFIGENEPKKSPHEMMVEFNKNAPESNYKDKRWG
ncbi:MAG: hypothetical protein WC570_00540 [Patescibacteria group bacterium]